MNTFARRRRFKTRWTRSRAERRLPSPCFEDTRREVRGEAADRCGNTLINPISIHPRWFAAFLYLPTPFRRTIADVPLYPYLICVRSVSQLRTDHVRKASTHSRLVCCRDRYRRFG